MLRLPPAELIRARRNPRTHSRCGFNLVELLIALAISAALLAATMTALDASFKAYQMTTEVASTHTVSRLTIERVQALIRTGQEFGPFPVNPKDSIVTSDYISFRTPSGTIVSLIWEPDDEALYLETPSSPSGGYLLMEGVVTPTDDEGEPIPNYHPFTLEYELGRKLYRATIDLAVIPDDNMSVQIEGENTQIIRLVASVMPRAIAYTDE